MVARLSLTVLLILATAGMSGCGRRGNLDRPSDARYDAEVEAAKAARQPAPPRPASAPERRFILDGLID